MPHAHSHYQEGESDTECNSRTQSNMKNRQGTIKDKGDMPNIKIQRS